MTAAQYFGLTGASIVGWFVIGYAVRELWDRAKGKNRHG